jgi:lysine 2,3-aminomutase
MEALIGHTSGFAVPTFVVDAPGGGGKIPLLPNYLLSLTGTKTVLRNYEGVICVYEEPANPTSECPTSCTICKNDSVKREPIGLQKLVDPGFPAISLVPEGNCRKARHREKGDEACGC